ncbi:MAG TPA: sensor histidine kinase [Actinomycetales bacterium]|nr:sensor histidine kinase [Actinomycetales bacterium]
MTRSVQRVAMLVPPRPSVVDLGIAGLLLVLAIGTTLGGHVDEGPLWLTLPVAVVMTGALVWRTRAPLTTLVTVLVAGQLQSLVGEQPGSLWALAAYLLATYSVAAGSTETRATVGGVAMVGVQWWQEWQQHGSDYLFVVLVFGGAWVLGRLVQQWQARARQAELNQEERARLAVAEERARIARELHDIVAHGVSVIAVQADAAEAVLSRDPERAREPIDVIRRSSREVLDEMRRLLQLLRMADPHAEDGAGDTAAPQPALEQLPDLVAAVAAAGLPVTLDDHRPGDGGLSVPPSVGLSAYRIVQEALTNVLKHSGSVATTVTVHHLDDALHVDVVNGAGLTSPARAAAGSGHGLLGMRERIALVGGELRAGPRPGGGFEVHAVMPMRTGDVVTSDDDDHVTTVTT